MWPISERPAQAPEDRSTRPRQVSKHIADMLASRSSNWPSTKPAPSLWRLTARFQPRLEVLCVGSGPGATRTI
jgi:hypothetical protein